MWIYAKVGSLPRERLMAKHKTKNGVSELNVGDILQVKSYPYEAYAKWLQVRIYHMFDGVIFLEQW